jgi:hypothetical protein
MLHPSVGGGSRMVHDWMDPDKRSAINAKAEAEARAEAERAKAWRAVTLREQAAGYLALAARLALVLGAGTGLWTLGWDVFQWLRFGIWSPTELWEVYALSNLPLPAISWVGVRMIVDQVLLIPVAVIAPLTGLVLCFGLAIAALKLEGSAR